MKEPGTPGAFSALQAHQIPSLPPSFYYLPNFISAEEESSILQKIPAQRWTTLSHRRLQAHPSTLTKDDVLLASPLPSFLVNPVVERFKALKIFKDTPHKEPNHVYINEYNPGEGIMPHEDGGAYAPIVATVSLGAPICLEISPKPTDENNNTQSPITESSHTEISAAENKFAGDDETTQNFQARDSGATQSEAPSLQYNLPNRILQEPRSLLITTGSAYVQVLHGIAPIAIDENLNAGTIANWNLLGDPSVFEEGGGCNKRSMRISLSYRDVLKVSSAASKVLGGIGKRF